MRRATLDTDELASRLGPLLGPGGAPRLEQMPTGMSSLTYLVERAGSAGPEALVVKVAPPGLEPVRNRDVLRQARVLRALAGVPDVAVPEVLFTDEGAPPQVPPLFGMARVAGECFEPLSDDGEVPPPAVVDARARSAATMLAALHAVDLVAVGLGGEPVVPLADEVARWTRLFATVDAELRPPEAVTCGERLAAEQPDPGPPVLLHGDYRLGNAICTDGAVVALIDWEIWTVSDARLDLAWFLLNSDEAKPNARRAGIGMPSRAELLRAYGGVDEVPGLGWFEALVRFKQAAASAAIVKNNRKRPEPDPRQEEVADYIEPLLVQALALLDGRRCDA